jgi:hypothetical protein
MTWLLMFVRLVEGVNGNLGMVRDLLTDDLQAVAKAAVATGHPRIGSLARKYTEELSRELQGVISTAETQTRWLLSDPMRASLSKNGIEFGRLKDRPTSVFLILPGGIELENHAVWLRLCVVSAVSALYRRGARRRMGHDVLNLNPFDLHAAREGHPHPPARFLRNTRSSQAVATTSVAKLDPSGPLWSVSPAARTLSPRHIVESLVTEAGVLEGGGGPSSKTCPM